MGEHQSYDDTLVSHMLLRDCKKTKIEDSNSCCNDYLFFRAAEKSPMLRFLAVRRLACLSLGGRLLLALVGLSVTGKASSTSKANAC
jgi:hypothetical protein